MELFEEFQSSHLQNELLMLLGFLSFKGYPSEKSCVQCVDVIDVIYCTCHFVYVSLQILKVFKLMLQIQQA